MKQIIYREMGNPSDVLTIEEKPSRTRNSEVRVAVLATPIHPSNLLKISGHYGIKPTFPLYLRAEGVGRITEVSAEELCKGRSTRLDSGYSTWQQELAGPASSFIPLPNEANIQQLSMLTINPLTAMCLTIICYS